MGHTALIVSAITGKAYSAAELLGEQGDDTATRELEAERDLKKLMKRMKKAGLA